MNKTEPVFEADLALPILKEELTVEVRQNVTGIVRLEKTVRELDQLIDQELLSYRFSIEHVPINQYIPEPASVRQEGETTIYPVMEEILIVTKQLVLKEEIRVTKHQTQLRYQENVAVRAEEVSVQRLSPREEAVTPADPVRVEEIRTKEKEHIDHV